MAVSHSAWTENAASGDALGTVSATHPEGATLTYSVSGAGVAEFNKDFALDSSSGEITVKSGATTDFESKPSYTVTLKATDSDGETDTIQLTITVRNVDESGTVSMSAPQPAVSEELTATLTDPDGAVSGESWQWSRSDGASDPSTDISGATSASYTPVEADKGKYLKARANYTDGHGSGKSAQTVAANAVVGIGAPVLGEPERPARTGTSASAAIEVTGEATNLKITWIDGTAGTRVCHANYKVNIFDPNASLLPRSPRQADSDSPNVFLAHNPHDDIEINYIQTVLGRASPHLRSLSAPIEGDLIPNERKVRVWCGEPTLADSLLIGEVALPEHTKVPELQSATVDGATLTLTFDESLYTTAVPPATAFSVTVNGSSHSISGVTVGENNAVLLLSSAVVSGDTVTVDYSAPTGSGALQNARGGRAASFTGQAVTNNTAP